MAIIDRQGRTVDEGEVPASNYAHSGLAIKAPCRVTTAANIALSGEQTIDGVAVVDGNRVLVRSQSTGSENGIYNASTGPWTRVTDMDGSGEIAHGTQVFVTDGSLNAQSQWYVSTADPIVIGTTAITFSQSTLDGTLAALAALDSSAGLLAQTAVDTFAKRTLTGTVNEISVANGGGTAGNPTISLPSALTFTGKTVTGGTFNNPTISGITTAMFAASVIDTDGTLAANSDTRLASQKAVKTYADALIAANDAMVFKGATDCSANPNYPAADRGHTYRVSVAGKIGGASGIVVEVGDIFICNADATASGNQATVGSSWNVIQTNIDGAVVGPSSATDNALARFDATTGKLVQNSEIILGDSDGKLTRAAGISVSGTNTNDSAAAGYVGEFASSTIASGSAVALTTGLPANITSISLTAGDWDVWINARFTGGATTAVTRLIVSVSSTSATLDSTSGKIFTLFMNGQSPFATTDVDVHAGPCRVSLASTTTVYFVAQTQHATSTCSGYGVIQARRRR